MSARTTSGTAGRAADVASRSEVLSVLRAGNGPMASTEVGDRVGLHANTARLHLEHLVAAGLATRQPMRRDGPGRPRSGYSAVPVPDFEPADDDAGERGYRLLAEILTSHLESTAPQPAEAAAAAGRAWGRVLAGRRGPARPPSVAGATEELAGLLDELGFAPRPPAPGRPLELRRCPFGQVAARHSAVVCAVHLGLMQGALAERGAPLRAAGLEPFVTPGMCLAHLDAHLDGE